MILLLGLFSGISMRRYREMRFRFMFMCVMLVLALTVTYAVAAPIHDAAGKGDLAKVKALLKTDPALVSLADKDGTTPLHYATAGNHKSVVELLLSQNANVNANKKDGVTPLHVAAAMGRVEIAKLLLAKGAKVDAVDDKDRTPISLAEESGQMEMIELLTAEGMSPAAAIAPGAKIGDICINPKDGAEMVWVPAGEFLMGSTDEDIAALIKAYWKLPKDVFDCEKPQHKVYLDGYWMYKYEVTVAQYRKFCEATKREMLKAPDWGWKDNHPMVMVTWQDAADYAKWAGVSLPTEAQWEKAARGTDGRIYPWGNTWDASKSANSEGKRLESTQPVGSYASDASSYGCMDMAGNVWEWCADWYDPHYYKNAPTLNPKGPASGSAPVLRGGSWLGGLDHGHFRCAHRRGCYEPTVRQDSYGFRCARTP